MTQELLKYINTELLFDDETEVNASDDLLEDGLIDSLGVMRLVAFIEEKYNISIPPEELTVENFQDVEAIVAYLESRK